MALVPVEEYVPADFTSNKIGAQKKVGRPNITLADGKVISSSKVVTAPSNASMIRAQNAEAERQLAIIEQQRIEKELRQSLEPSKLEARISYMERTIKKLQKQIKELQGGK